MSDLVDAVVTHAWSSFQDAVNAGLKADPSLEHLVGVSTIDDATPYRVKSVEWVPLEVHDLFRRCHIVDFEGAYELEVHLDARVADLRDTPLSIASQLSLLGSEARRLERMCVLHVVAGQADADASLAEVTIDAVVELLVGQWRLVAGGDLVAAAHGSRLIQDVVDPHCALDPGLSGILVRLDGGPEVQRVGGDFCLAWQRLDPAATMRFSLSERFFVTNASSAVRLM